MLYISVYKERYHRNRALSVTYITFQCNLLYLTGKQNGMTGVEAIIRLELAITARAQANYKEFTN
jgi:hypothetical protein